MLRQHVLEIERQGECLFRPTYARNSSAQVLADQFSFSVREFFARQASIQPRSLPRRGPNPNSATPVDKGSDA